MTASDHVSALLAEVEEEFEFDGYVGLYEFSWSLRGLKLGLDESGVMETARAAYDEFVQRHDVRLVWSPWPIDLERAEPAADDVEIDLDLDPDSPVSKPLLVLVPR